MLHFDPHKTGLVCGVLLGTWHLIWAVFVLFGLAQPLINFIFVLHMLRPLFMVDNFSFVLAVSLALVTSIMGYLLGYFSAVIWNRLYK